MGVVFFAEKPKASGGQSGGPAGGRGAVCPSHPGRHGAVQGPAQAAADAAGVGVSRSVDHFVCADGDSVLSGLEKRQVPPDGAPCAGALRGAAGVQLPVVHAVFQWRDVSGGVF